MNNQQYSKFIFILILGIACSCSNKKIDEKLHDLLTVSSPDKGIDISNPYNNSLLPPEMSSPTFEWTDSSFFTNQWHVIIASENGKVIIKDKIEGLKWRPDSLEWLKLKKDNIEKNCQFIVIGLDKNKKTEDLSWAKISFKISKDSVGAEIFFRAVTLPFSYAVKNVHTMEWYLGNVDGSSPRKMLDNMPVCANCHSFSKKDAVLAMDVDYGNDKGSYVISETNDTSYLSPGKIISWSNFKKNETEPTFGLLSQISPDGQYVLSTVKDLSVFTAIDDNLAYSQLFFPIKGIIGIYDRLNNEFKELHGANNQLLVQSNPSWSPDGKNIVFARTNAYFSERVANAGRALLHPKDIEEFTSGKKEFKFDLYTIPFNDGSGGQAVPLKGASGDSMSNYFPKFSPDGRWIVFCKARNFMLLQPDSRLYIVPAEGGEARLMNCNMQNMNSWHSWSPNGKWIVFSSKQNGLYTQLYLTHIDENGNDSPPVLIENLVFNKRAVNIPEFYPKNATNFKKIKDDFSNTAPYYTQTASDQMDNLFYKKAWTNLEKAIKTDSTYLDAYFKRITLNALLHQSGSNSDNFDKIKAMEIINNLIKNDLKNEHLVLLKATLLSNLGKNTEALDLLNEVLKIHPENIKAYELKASIYRKTGNFEKAIPVYYQIIKLHPQTRMAFTIQIIMANKEIKKQNLALSQINDLIKEQPNDEGLRMLRAQLAIEMQNLKLAKTDIDWLIKSDNANYKYYQLYTHYNVIANENEAYKINAMKIISLLNSEINKNPENMELYFQRALAKQSMKQFNDAMNDYRHILSTFPTNYESLKQIAKIQLSQQYWNDAIATYKKLIDNYPREEEFYNNSALAYINTKNYKMASYCFEKAVSINPENVNARYNKARLHKMMNEHSLGNNEENEILKILELKKQKGTINSSELELIKSLNR